MTLEASNIQITNDCDNAFTLKNKVDAQSYTISLLI